MIIISGLSWLNLLKSKSKKRTVTSREGSLARVSQPWHSWLHETESHRGAIWHRRIVLTTSPRPATVPHDALENLADVLENIALLLELKGDNPFKIRAYRQGAETVRNFDGEIVELARKTSSTASRESATHCATSSTNWPAPANLNSTRNSVPNFQPASSNSSMCKASDRRR